MGNCASAANLLLYFVHIGLSLNYLDISYLGTNSSYCHFMNLGNRRGELQSHCSLACMAIAVLRRLSGDMHLSRYTHT